MTAPTDPAACGLCLDCWPLPRKGGTACRNADCPCHVERATRTGAWAPKQGDYIAPPNVFCIAGTDGKPTAPGLNGGAHCGRYPGDHDLLMASKADARVVIAARKLVAWIDGGSQVEPWPNASNLNELRDALAAHPAGHAYVSAWLPCTHCSSMIRWVDGQYEDSLGGTGRHSPRSSFSASDGGKA